MLKQNDARLALSMAAALSLSILTAAGVQAQGYGMDSNGRQLVSPSQMPQQPQLNQVLQKRSAVGTYAQTPPEVVLPPGIPESTRIGELQSLTNVQKGAMGILMGFNLLACVLWLFTAARAEIKLDRFYHGDPLNTGKADRTDPAANPVTAH